MANLTITDDDGGLSESLNHEDSQEIYKKCFTLPDYYKQCLSFYHKGKDVIKMSYQDKIRLTALWKQASAGKYDLSKIPEVGYFDVVGNDRKLAWEALGDMPKEKAMEEFCCLVEKLAPELEAYLEAQHRDIEEKKRKKLEEERRKQEEEEERRRKEEEERVERERLIIEEQNRKLAEEEEEEERKRQEILKTEEQKSGFIMQQKPQVNGTPSIAPASLWSRPKVQEFIQHVRTDPGSVLVVGRGETITVRVPTHENGTCLFWEFATENYDVGFGVSFEWSLPSSEAITVEVDETEDEAIKDDMNETQKPRIDEILPTVRRPCNEEVMVGSHLYPGRGVYQLKFDNSYSLFRSKTLYYRVYYTR